MAPSKQQAQRRLCTSTLALGALLAAASRLFSGQGFQAFSMTNVRGAHGLLKEKLLLGQQPTQASIAALESTSPKCLVSSISDLKGTWHVTSPKENAPKGLMHGDVPRMLLNLYTGDIGRMLSMDVVDAPILHITADGRTSTQTGLRWGRQQDHITLQGRLELVGTNLLREKPKATRSDALKLTLPAMQRDREMKITYFDGTLMIFRDSRGIVDVLWREEEEPEPEEEEEPAGSEPATPEDEVESLRENVKTLLNSVEALRHQSHEDKEVHQKLNADIKRLEKELKAQRRVAARAKDHQEGPKQKVEALEGELVTRRSELEALEQREDRDNKLAEDIEGDLTNMAGMMHVQVEEKKKSDKTKRGFWPFRKNV